MAKPIPEETWDRVCQVYREVRSFRATARRLGMSKSGVEHVLRARGVPRFPRNRCGSENSAVKAILADVGSASAKVRDYAFMHDLYVMKQLSMPDIAELLGIDNTTVLTGLRFCGIQRRSISESLRGKARPTMTGSQNHAWKGGVTSWRKLAREGLNAVFVRPVMVRDGFTCRWCGDKQRIVVHHERRSFMEIVRIIRDRHPDTCDNDLVREIITEHSLDDGITLCKRCHDQHHKEHGK